MTLASERGGSGLWTAARDRARAWLDGGFWRRGALAAFLGLAASFSQAPYSLWPAALIGPAGALALGLTAVAARQAAAIGWLFGVGYFLPGLLWIGSAFLVEAEKFAWMQPFAVTLLPMGLALFWTPVFWAGWKAARRHSLDGALAGAVVAAGLWALAELARGYVLTGFPWGLFAFAWIETPAAQTAAWIGPYGLNLATLLAIGLLAAALLAATRAAALGRLGAALAVIALLQAAGWTRLPGATPAEEARQGALIRLVQPNVPQKEKWVEEYRARNFSRLIQLSTGPSAGPLTYVVWPETATSFMIDRVDRLRADIMAALPAGARLVLGSQRYEPAEGEDAEDLWKARFYNSLFVVGEGGAIEASYDKHHLVPFGEFLPFQELLQSFGIYQLAGRSTGFSTGPGPSVITIPGAPSFAPLICYEAIFPQEMPAPDNRPALLLQVTNDAWFGRSSGPWQHLVQAQFRAIEQGIPLVRSANTGITASIDPYGRIEQMLELDVIGAIDVRPAAALSATPYARSGDLPAGLAMLLAAAIGWLLARRDATGETPGSVG